MMKPLNRRASAVLAALAALVLGLGLGGCATTSPGPGANNGAVTADAALLQRLDGVLRQASPAISVRLRLSAAELRIGEAIAAEIGANTAGYVYLFQLGSDGRSLSLLFPNAMDGANHLPAGASLTLPRPQWRMSARGPAGVAHMLAVVSATPQDLMQLQAQTQQGRIELSGAYGAALLTVRELAP